MRTGAAAIAACWFGMAFGAGAQTADEVPRPRIEATVRDLALELSAVCPLVHPGNQRAFDECRQALFHDSTLRRTVNTILLWGRPHPKPGEVLKDTNLTQFAPEVWTGLYAPLFMFDGTWSLRYDEGERLYQARLGALFRNALDPGQYPYPFWHNARKWNDYQSANTLLLWIAPQSGRIVVGQFTNDAQVHPGLVSKPVTPPPFEGQWMWTDTSGNTQPAPALFRGLFSNDNPHLRELEPAYRDLANAMRRGHCNDCHVPDNPNRMKRLVLLQTPAHAASEIERLMKSVRDNQMPIDDSLLYHDIDPDSRAALLDFGGIFEDLVDAARAWEAARPSRR